MERFKGGCQLAPHYAGKSLSDSRGKFFQAGLLENVSVLSFSAEEEKRSEGQSCCGYVGPLSSKFCRGILSVYILLIFRNVC